MGDGGDGRVEETVAARLLADFTVASAPGNERDAIARVADALAPLDLTAARLERLKTATAEATMNAMEHGNGYDPALDVRIVVAAGEDEGDRADQRPRRRRAHDRGAGRDARHRCQARGAASRRAAGACS